MTDRASRITAVQSANQTTPKTECDYLYVNSHIGKYLACTVNPRILAEEDEEEEETKKLRCFQTDQADDARILCSETKSATVLICDNAGSHFTTVLTAARAC